MIRAARMAAAISIRRFLYSSTGASIPTFTIDEMDEMIRSPFSRK
jgi:hypothetical protein